MVVSLETPQKAGLKHHLIISLESIYPGNSRIFGLDGFEAGPEEVVLKIASKCSDSFQAYLYICYVLRVAADMVYKSLGPDALLKLLRLQELAGP